MQQQSQPYPQGQPGPAPVQQTIVQVPVTQGAFDAGARFTPYSTQHVPPPPPGVMPNAAQLGMAPPQGQKKGGFLKGTGSGGYTFW